MLHKYRKTALIEAEQFDWSRELAKQIDSGYKCIEIMVDQKLKEAGIE